MEGDAQGEEKTRRQAPEPRGVRLPGGAAMICKCGKTALYHVEDVGYCRDHYREAQGAMGVYSRKMQVKQALGRLLAAPYSGGPNMAAGGSNIRREDRRVLAGLRSPGITSIDQFLPEKQERRQHESVKAKRMLPSVKKHKYDVETRPNPNKQHPPRMKVFKEVK
jgi:hypothetical protein